MRVSTPLWSMGKGIPSLDGQRKEGGITIGGRGRAERGGRGTTIDSDGNATTKPFAEGWLTDGGEYLGRPVDIAELRDGSILVSDDLAGAIYRISYGE